MSVCSLATLKHRFGRVTRDESGATAIEYALVICLIALGALAALQSAGGANGANWDNIAAKSGKAMTGAGN